jgi:hypothetical protein
MIDFAEINEAALSNLESFVRSWFPDGRMRGVEWVCRNPHRVDRRIGSLSVNTRTGVWKDFASGDGGSDPISQLAFVRACSQIDAARELAGILGIDTGGGWKPVPRPDPKPIPPAWTTTAKPKPNVSALRLWRKSVPIAGTLGHDYLRGRAITINPGDSCRFHGNVGYWLGDPENPDGPPRLLHRGPALVLGFRYGDDPETVGVHRVYLDDRGRKLRLDDPDEPGELLPAKKASGLFRGCHIRFGEWPSDDAGDGIEAVASEGPENCLSLCQGLNLPGLCSLSSGNLPLVRLPSSVKSVVIGADPDPAGMAAATKAQISFAEQGVEARVIVPPEGAGDWNDVLRAEEGIRS